MQPIPMQPQKQLPPHYQPVRVLDLAHNRLALLGLSVGAIAAFFLFGWLALALLAALRPDVTAWTFQVSGANVWSFLLGLIGFLAVTVILHEAVHGLCFWLLTRECPRFAFKGLYAYAAATDWYLPRLHHVAVALAPLVVITGLGLLWLLVAPAGVVLSLTLLLVLNASGAVGDLVAVVWLLRQPCTTLVSDRGDAITLYQPAPTA